MLQTLALVRAEDREGRIVGMDGEPCAFLLGHLGDLAHKGDQIGAHVFDADLRIERERPPEAHAVVSEIARGQPVDQRPLERLSLIRRHRLETRAGRGDPRRRVASLGAIALEHEKVVSGEIDRVEAQGRSPLGKRQFRSVRVQSVIAMKL